METANGLNGNGKDIKKYLATIRIAQVFSESTDDKLQLILNIIKENKNNKPFAELLKNKMFAITQENLEYALQCTKKDAFNILSLLYDKKYDECKFDLDHMHPISAFTKSNLKQLNLNDNDINDWMRKADTLPNLQILKSAENESKGKIPLEQWVESTYTDQDSKNRYFRETYLNDSISLQLQDFPAFYENRKQIIRQKLIDMLNITFPETKNEE